MLSILGKQQNGFCDGLSRRSFLKIGGLALGGMSMPEILRAEAASGVRSLARCKSQNRRACTIYDRARRSSC